MKSVSINTSPSYSVHIGEGLLERAGALLLEAFGARTVALITDQTVDALYGAQVEHALAQAGFRVVKRAFAGGELHKNMHTVEDILAFLAKSAVTRSDLIVALGGGVVGDVAGFCAAIYLRGIRFVQLPTTFLAAIDSSVGGKTGVNLAAGKNLAGAFWQPSCVLCDTRTFDTLPREVFLDGVAEALKYGVLWDEALFERLAASGKVSDIEDVTTRCVEIKSILVSEDERDVGRRQLLNLGHTLGHAIERVSGYAVSHGHAVAVGMAAAARASEKLGVAKAPCSERITAALMRYGLPVNIDLPIDQLCPAMAQDKKRAGDTITLVLPERIGACRLVPFSVEELTGFARLALDGATV